MTSKTVAQLLADLGVLKSHSRPHVSNDNPYSEAQFKTLKYSPRFPARFTSLADCRTFVDEFFQHYNHHHRHSGIGLHTPADVHHGLAEAIRVQRHHVLDVPWTVSALPGNPGLSTTRGVSPRRSGPSGRSAG